MNVKFKILFKLIMKNIKKIKRFFTDKNSVCVIAEACDNHFGSLELAKKMIIQSKKSGADVIKFQHHLPDEEMLPNVPKSSNFDMPLYEFLKKYALKLKDHEKLKAFCDKHNIIYLCTPFSLKAAYELNEIGVEWFKIGSGEMTDTPTIEKILDLKKPILVSTGMSTLTEIKRTYELLKKKSKFFSLLNCTSEYPPDLKDLNLRFIEIMKKNFNKAIIGHSDHTSNIFTSMAAVTLGAKFIEKHIYISDKFSGPDKDVSISIQQLKKLVEAINIIKPSLGDQKKINKKELPIRKWAFRSIVSLRDFNVGEILKKDMIWSKRPGTGIPSFKMYDLIGKKIKKKVKKNTLLKYSDLK